MDNSTSNDPEVKIEENVVEDNNENVKNEENEEVDDNQEQAENNEDQEHQEHNHVTDKSNDKVEEAETTHHHNIEEPTPEHDHNEKIIDKIIEDFITPKPEEIKHEETKHEEIKHEEVKHEESKVEDTKEEDTQEKTIEETSDKHVPEQVDEKNTKEVKTIESKEENKTNDTSRTNTSNTKLDVEDPHTTNNDKVVEDNIVINQERDPPIYDPIDLEKEIEHIIEGKKIANKKTQTDPSHPEYKTIIESAIKDYLTLIDYIKVVLNKEQENVKDDRNPSIKNDHRFADFMKEYKLIMSNLAFSYKKIRNFTESIVYDQRVI